MIAGPRGNILGIRQGQPRAPVGSPPDMVAKFVRSYQKKTMCFECPGSGFSNAPDLAVTSRKGAKVFMLRWQVHYTGLRLLCQCGGVLKGKRWGTSAKRLVLFRGVHGYAMQYTEQCPIAGGECCRVGDGRRLAHGQTACEILQQVESQEGRHARRIKSRMCPVDPPYALSRSAFPLTGALPRLLNAKSSQESLSRIHKGARSHSAAMYFIR